MSTSYPSSFSERRGAEELRQKAGAIQQDLRDFGSAARHTAEDALGAVRETASEYLGQGRERALELGQTVETQIRDQPLRAVLIAAGVGFLIGACFMRR